MRFPSLSLSAFRFWPVDSKNVLAHAQMATNRLLKQECILSIDLPIWERILVHHFSSWLDRLHYKRQHLQTERKFSLSLTVWKTWPLLKIDKLWTFLTVQSSNFSQDISIWLTDFLMHMEVSHATRSLLIVQVTAIDGLVSRSLFASVVLDTRVIVIRHVVMAPHRCDDAATARLCTWVGVRRRDYSAAVGKRRHV